MKKTFVDTNIFIEVFSRIGDKSNRCKKLLQEKEGELTTSCLVLAEVEWVLRSGYEESKEKVIRCLKKILTSSIEIDDKGVLLNAFNLYQKTNLDWTDCINACFIKKGNYKGIYSYDKDFDKVNFIKRIEP